MHCSVHLPRCSLGYLFLKKRHKMNALMRGDRAVHCVYSTFDNRAPHKGRTAMNLHGVFFLSLTIPACTPAGKQERFFSPLSIQKSGRFSHRRTAAICSSTPYFTAFKSRLKIVKQGRVVYADLGSCCRSSNCRV
jgi:hypothetical protein